MILEIDLKAPLDKIKEEFKTIIRSVYKERNANLLRENKRFNPPPFEKWRAYIISYMLREKGVVANSIDADWPKKILSRPEIAEILFSGNAATVDQAVREAKVLIKEAVNRDGHFKNCNFYNTGACYS